MTSTPTASRSSALRRLRAIAASPRPRWAARLWPALACTLGGFATVALLVAVQRLGAPLWAVNLALMVPAAVTAVVVRRSVRRLYRWVVILLIAQVVHPAATAPFLLAAVTWALYRSWVLERGPGPAAHTSGETGASRRPARPRTRSTT